MSDEACSMNVWIFVGKRNFRPDNRGMLPKCRFFGTDERIWALRTVWCRVRDERSRFRGGRR